MGMMALHMTKVAFGCASLDVLVDRIAARAVDGAAPVWTRYRPTRHVELIGGSLFWIIKHRLVARQTILGFEETDDGKWIIRVDARVAPVCARPKRAHQGWRYLKGEDAPNDLDDSDDLSALPASLLGALAELALV